jgi:predicted HD phosphohydrolase
MTVTNDPPSSFRAMDASTAEQWQAIFVEHDRNRGRVADRVLGLLESLAEITDGFAVDQLTHSLQTAARAEQAGASDEVVVASLCHDIGKAISIANHPAIAAEILRPYVSRDVCEMIRAHQDFQGRHYYQFMGKDPDARERYAGAAYYELAERFADEWDQTSFDPDLPTPPLAHFEARVRSVFARERGAGAQ